MHVLAFFAGPQWDSVLCISLYSYMGFVYNSILSLPSWLRRITSCAIIITVHIVIVVIIVIIVVVFVHNIFFDHCRKRRDMDTYDGNSINLPYLEECSCFLSRSRYSLPSSSALLRASHKTMLPFPCTGLKMGGAVVAMLPW